MNGAASIPIPPATTVASADNAVVVELELSAPAALPGAEISTALALLQERAARHAEIAAGFIRAGDRASGRAHLRAAVELLNEVELED